MTLAAPTRSQGTETTAAARTRGDTRSLARYMQVWLPPMLNPASRMGRSHCSA